MLNTPHAPTQPTESVWTLRKSQPIKRHQQCAPTWFPTAIHAPASAKAWIVSLLLHPPAAATHNSSRSAHVTGLLTSQTAQVVPLPTTCQMPKAHNILAGCGGAQTCAAQNTMHHTVTEQAVPDEVCWKPSGWRFCWRLKATCVDEQSRLPPPFSGNIKTRPSLR